MPDIHIGPARLRDYVKSRPGDLITTAEVAAALGWTEDTADGMLRVLAQDRAYGELTERQGGWVYWPPGTLSH